MRAEYREREREHAAAEEQRIAAFAREQAQREEERRAVQSAQNEYRERMQQEVTVCYSIILIGHLFMHVYLCSLRLCLIIIYLCMCVHTFGGVKTLCGVWLCLHLFGYHCSGLHYPNAVSFSVIMLPL